MIDAARNLFSAKPLFLITDGGPLRLSEGLIERLDAALEGASQRVAAVLVREQVLGSDARAASASDDELCNLLDAALPRCRRHGAALLVHGRPDLAVRCGVDGVHLTRRTMPAHSARTLLGEGALIGFSTHDEQEISDAFQSGSSYVFFSPIFTPGSKQRAEAPLGPDALAAAARRAAGPIVALGGITPQTISACRRAGAAAAAVISAIFAADDPHEAARRLIAAWDAAG